MGLLWGLSSLKKKKKLPVSAGDGLILGLERFLGRENSDPLQHSCLRSPLDKGAWRARVHGVTESDETAQLSHNKGDNVIYLSNLSSSCFSPLSFKFSNINFYFSFSLVSFAT